ncbi:hypothetical protein M947_05295 [Sulfurimonas hongkongensis]|uniref:SIR2-like domain-containing protein n=1 Tax=Sulfurimonas hongkongensis TaxID=1172190 RepID=T0KQS3_9BACT|nr:hypothetical protein [Sulfurimonas hongkongensis]EQB39409.1 hypothetical protein M947_05295 [Sulfurimonas hongkongensis]
MGVVSKQEEINQVEIFAPHVVILGAGASYAAFPNGDINGNKLPLMNNLISTLKLENLIDKTNLNFETNNFEEIYDLICKNEDLQDIQLELEEEVYRYFHNLSITEQPTIYDHLLLSLREKDVIATFNWDPFLIQAYYRNGKEGFKLPKLLFLHGNVAVGFCEEDSFAGVNGHKCKYCEKDLQPTRLLYPISEKNYHKDGFIKAQWETLQGYLEKAFMISIFGYGAPQSDKSAIELMKKAWGDVEDRNMEQTEIIDIREEDDLEQVWSPFIHTHHREFHKNFYDSFIANHPRRTGEAYYNQYWMAKFIENNPLPKDSNFDELWNWYQELQDVENSKNT